MATIIQGIGMSHSPMMAVNGKYWDKFQNSDSNNRLLYDENGKHVTFEQLRQSRSDRYASDSRPEILMELYHKMNQCFAHLKAEAAKLKPDVMVVIGNDHAGEFFDSTSVPALAVFYGDQLTSAYDVKRGISSAKNRYKDIDAIPGAYEEMVEGMGIDQHYVWPGSSKVGMHLIESLIKQFDIGVLRQTQESTDGHGHGHAYGMAVKRLMDENSLIPMVPIYINTWSPNVLSPSRCYDLGRALRAAIEQMPDDLRITIVASGGLSHFVTDENLDQYVINALQARSEQDLRMLPEHLLKAGNAEILNWVVLAAAVEHLEFDWHEYVPVYRTPSGTGIGMTFANWV